MRHTSNTPIIIVMLRQPRMERPNEMRSDPFWEFGSFGVTGCHQRNLMHPKKAAELEGARMAFAQGGKDGFKLVYLTPPVHAIAYADRSEIRWDPSEMPFRYDRAPVIIDAAGASDIPELRALFEGVKRNGWVGRFASKFRTRREPLPEPIAARLVAVYSAARRSVSNPKLMLAQTYEQALPVNPPKVDRQRRATYRELLAKIA
ncbi:MAG TPA: hypothetical protein V6C69_19925 [Trichormus sp.]|jgi:hypothetical protein